MLLWTLQEVRTIRGQEVPRLSKTTTKIKIKEVSAGSIGRSDISRMDVLHKPTESYPRHGNCYRSEPPALLSLSEFANQGAACSEVKHGIVGDKKTNEPISKR